MLSPDNPFAQPFEYPPFDAIAFDHLQPALVAGMAEQRREVDTIADGPWPPTFADTVEALERSGRLLERAGAVFFALASGQSTPELRELEQDLMPELAAHRDAIALDPRLYARIADLVARHEELGLDAEQARLLERYRRDFVRSGAELDPAGQERLRAINERISSLTAAFRTKLLEDTADSAVHVDDVAELDGLPEPMVAAARQAAARARTATASRSCSRPASPRSSSCTTGRCASASTARRSAAAAGATRTTRAPSRPRSPRCGRSAPACLASPATPPTSSTTPRPARSRRS